MSRLLGHYIDRTGRPAIDGKYLDPQRFEDGVARVSSPRDGRVGLIDGAGKLLVDYRFDFVMPFAEGLARINVGGQLHNGNPSGGAWGLLARDGRVVVEPAWASACDAEEGRITVERDGQFGFLDVDGNLVVEPRWSYASWHRCGLAVVAGDDGDCYVDRDGVVAIAGPFQEATPFVSDVARVKVDDHWGMIDRTGKLVHEPTYERVGQLRDGACWAVKGGKCYVLTAAGVLGDDWFDEIRQAGEDGIWPVRKGDHWGFLLADGRVVAMEYQGTLGFLGGFGRAQRDGKWGFCNRDGELVVPCRYDDAWGHEEGRVAVLVDGGWTFLDDTGAEIGPGGFAAGSFFKSGMAAVRKDDRWGFLDRDGAMVVPPSFDWADHFGGDLAAVLVADRAGVALPAARDGVHVLPEGGLTHPVFEKMGPHSHLIAILGFSRFLDSSELGHLHKLIAAWEHAVHPAGKLYTEDKWVSAFDVYLRVENLADPRGDVALLVDELFAAGLPISETLFARWGTPPGEEIMFPNADPRMGGDFEANFADFPEYWDAVWNPEGPAPAPENYYYLKGALQTRDGGLCLEERHMPLWFPDVRVCMGALQGQGEDYLDPDDASERVHQAVRRAVEERFAGVWIKPGIDRFYPYPMVRSGDPGVEPIAYQDRTGYAFAFDCGDLLHWFSAERMRYRERELMEALHAVIGELELEPVILWQRFQQQIPMLPMGQPTVLVVNLWNKPTA